MGARAESGSGRCGRRMTCRRECGNAKASKRCPTFPTTSPTAIVKRRLLALGDIEKAAGDIGGIEPRFCDPAPSGLGHRPSRPGGKR